MALSRIWCAFILIAIAVACIKLVTMPVQNNTVFTNMVAGKTGDSIKIRVVDSATLAAPVNAYLDSNKVFNENGVQTIKVGTQKRLSFKIQSADGIIETCQTAVTLCLRLIGFMALFMGLMSIAERAGGIRFLSKIIGPFFSKIFPEIPKGHESMGHMMMNFSAMLRNPMNKARIPMSGIIISTTAFFAVSIIPSTFLNNLNFHYCFFKLLTAFQIKIDK